MEKWLLVALGGGVGAVLRVFIAQLLQRPAGDGFPIGTLAVNATGCFVIGLLAALFAGPLAVREEHRMAILAGVLGGYTTFSAFAWETVRMLNEGRMGRAALYVVLTNVLCLAGAFAGQQAARLWPAGRPLSP